MDEDFIAGRGEIAFLSLTFDRLTSIPLIMKEHKREIWAKSEYHYVLFSSKSFLSGLQRRIEVTIVVKVILCWSEGGPICARVAMFDLENAKIQRINQISMMPVRPERGRSTWQ